MDERVIQIIKDLSEILLHIVSIICLVIQTKYEIKKSSKSKRKKK